MNEKNVLFSRYGFSERNDTITVNGLPAAAAPSWSCHQKTPCQPRHSRSPRHPSSNSADRGAGWDGNARDFENGLLFLNSENDDTAKLTAGFFRIASELMYNTQP